MNSGTTAYTRKVGQVSARGASFDDAELDDALKGPVRNILRDTRGRADLARTLGSVSKTGFATQTLERIINASVALEDWRVGEALAESYLVRQKACEFPWPGGRDLKNPSASPAGTDLVGFEKRGDRVRFAFGEVKTSYEDKYPPSVLYGRHSLTEQIEALRDDEDLRAHLIAYLFNHGHTSAWLATFLAAWESYNDDKNRELSLFGVLVRDVAAHEDDLRTRTDALAKGCPTHVTIALDALYLPLGAIGNLVTRARRLGGLAA